jgi:branched-chain amino acid transport system substrate-binding protein
MKLWRNTLGLMVGAGFAGLVGSTALAADDTLTVGMPVAQTEFMALFDQALAGGFMLAVEEINAAGGIDGRIKIEVIQKDTRSDAAQSLLLSQEMIDDGAEVLFISSGTADVFAAGPMISAAEKLALTASTNPSFQAVAGDYIKTLGPGDNQSGSALATFARESLGINTAFLVISPDDPFTANSPRYFAEIFEKKGGKIVGEASFNLFQGEFGTIVQQIKNMETQPDAIMTYMFEPDFPVFAKQLRAAGITSKIIVGDGIDTPSVVPLSDSVSGIYHFTTLPEGVSDAPQFANLIGVIRDAYGADMTLDAFTAWGYTSAKLVEAAVIATGSTDAKDLNAWISNLENYDSGTASLTWKGVGSQPLADYHFVELKDGARVYLGSARVDPADIPAAID